MTILAMDGFDLYNGTQANIGLLSGWQSRSWFYTPALVVGRFGGQGLQTGNGSACETALPMPSANSSFAVCHAFRVGALASLNDAGTEPATQLLSLGNHQLGWRPTTTGAVRIYRGTTLLFTTAPNVIQNGVWHFVEFFGTINGTTGTVNITVDGVSRAALTAQNTNGYATNVTFDAISIGNPGNLGGGNLTFDDLYVTDGASLGERRIETLRPLADVAVTWTPTPAGAPNANKVNATLAQSTSYVQTATVGNLDLYTIAALSSSPTAIDAVQMIAHAQKTDAATRAIAAVADLAGVQTIGANIPMAVGIGRYTTIMPTKPGGGAWSGANVQALRIGPKVIV